jgi:hypothetical protein
MKPSEAAYPMEAWRQDVLEKAPQELQWLQVDSSPSCSAAVTKRPAEPAIGQELKLAIAGGGFEHVTAQVAQSLLTASD